MMERIEHDYKQVEVTYKYFLPDNASELWINQNAVKFMLCLHDVYDLCRHTWKYKEDATEAEIDLAEKIGEMVSESGVFDCE